MLFSTESLITNRAIYVFFFYQKTFFAIMNRANVYVTLRFSPKVWFEGDLFATINRANLTYSTTRLPKGEILHKLWLDIDPTMALPAIYVWEKGLQHHLLPMWVMPQPTWPNPPGGCGGAKPPHPWLDVRGARVIPRMTTRPNHAPGGASTLSKNEEQLVGEKKIHHPEYVPEWSSNTLLSYI